MNASAKVANVLSGWIVLDKPSGITSAHAVAKVKRLLKPAKIGHAGTLDPLASGILPLALGEATKTVSYMMDTAKSYSFTVTWGESRDTDDSEGKTLETSPIRPTVEEIQAVLSRFTGNIMQVPPHYSAILVDGQRSYDLAREGNAAELKARQVTVKSLELLESGETATFLCHCGKGTYIRSLARDMGRALGCLGYVSQLRRLSVGKFNENNAISLEVLAEMVHKGDLNFVQPVESALDDIPACELDSSQAMLLKRGQALIFPATMELPQGTVIAKQDGTLVAICSVTGHAMKPVRVFNL